MSDSTQSNLQRVTVVKYGNEAKNMVRGTAELIPDPHVDMGKIYNLSGLGAFFSGNYYTTSVTHTFNSSGYRQQAEFIKQHWDGSADIVVEKGKTSPRPKRPVAPTHSSPRTHIVAEGETLWSIAHKYYLDGNKWGVIEKANHSLLVKRDHRNSDSSGHWVYAGMKLIIP